MAKKNPAPKHSAPVDLTEEEVRAAREGKGTHRLPEAGSRGKGSYPVKPARTQKAKR